MAASPKEYWGDLIDPETKGPSPRLEQLLLGIAHYVIKNTEPRDHHVLSPAKLAAFYRAVGGDFDALFLDTPAASISFIYTALGCFHSLQPSENPYEPPSIPALTTQGFVRWETIQILLEPDEHVAFLQEAVRTYPIPNKSEGGVFGGLFPANLPRACFPEKPDDKMCRWHEETLQKLKQGIEAGRTSSRPSMQQRYSGTPGQGEHSSGEDDEPETSVDAGGGYFAYNVTKLKDKLQQRFGVGNRPSSKDSRDSREWRYRYHDDSDGRRRRSPDSGRPGKGYQSRSSDETSHRPRGYRPQRTPGYSSPSSPESPMSGGPRPPPRRSDYSEKPRYTDRAVDNAGPPASGARLSRPAPDANTRRHSAHYPHSTLSPEDEPQRARSRSHDRSPGRMSPSRFASHNPDLPPRPASGYFTVPVTVPAMSGPPPPGFARGSLRHTVNSPGGSPYRGRKRDDSYEKDPGRRLEEGYRYVPAERTHLRG